MILPEEKKMFYTPVWEYQVEDYEELNALLRVDINVFRSGNNFFDYSGRGAKTLLSVFKDSVFQIVERYPWKRSPVEFRCRVNPIEPLEIDTPHFHSDCRVVGVYYLHVPPGSGDILLHDPRGYTNWDYDSSSNTITDNSPAKEKNKSSRAYHRITPREGTMLLHPSYVVHSIEPNLSDEIRISFAMVAN